MQHQDDFVAVSRQCPPQCRGQDDASVESQAGHTIGSSRFDFTTRRRLDRTGKNLGGIGDGV